LRTPGFAQGTSENSDKISVLTAPQLSEADFRRIRDLVYETAGIHLLPVKRLMVESRLRKRLEELRLPSYRAYCNLLAGPEGRRELTPLLDRITTNKTDFFREPGHFDFLIATAIPALAERHGAGLRRPLALWSAGCSSGEEPYTLAMVLSEHAGRLPPGRFRFRICASDISTRVLEKAQAATYTLEAAAPVPPEFRRKYFLRAREQEKPLFRIRPELRALVDFRRLNLMDRDFGFPHPLDAIFCRNVMIYFDRTTQAAAARRLAANLVAGGFLFIGHSESLNGLDVPLVMAAPSVYRKAH
jgi:chemotaxis protein methyltransferase CheR